MIGRNQAGSVERYESLFLGGSGGSGDADFMRGFAYGRFTELDSELALHWGLLRNHPADACPISDGPTNLIDRISALQSRVEVLEGALELAQRHLAWLAENEPGTRPDITWRWANEARAALKADEPVKGGTSNE